MINFYRQRNILEGGLKPLFSFKHIQYEHRVPFALIYLPFLLPTKDKNMTKNNTRTILPVGHRSDFQGLTHTSDLFSVTHWRTSRAIFSKQTFCAILFTSWRQKEVEQSIPTTKHLPITNYFITASTRFSISSRHEKTVTSNIMRNDIDEDMQRLLYHREWMISV